MKWFKQGKDIKSILEIISYWVSRIFSRWKPFDDFKWITLALCRHLSFFMLFRNVASSVEALALWRYESNLAKNSQGAEAKLSVITSGRDVHYNYFWQKTGQFKIFKLKLNPKLLN